VKYKALVEKYELVITDCGNGLWTYTVRGNDGLIGGAFHETNSLQSAKAEAEALALKTEYGVIPNEPRIVNWQETK
jgi:hypothetical protein